MILAQICRILLVKFSQSVFDIIAQILLRYKEFLSTIYKNVSVDLAVETGQESKLSISAVCSLFLTYKTNFHIWCEQI